MEKWIPEILCVCDLCSVWLNVFHVAIVHSFSTSHHYQAKPENIASFNLRPLNWPYMEMSGGFCSIHVPQAYKDVVQLEGAFRFH